MHFHWPQIVEICLMAFSFLLHGMNHGKPTRGTYNGFVSMLVIAVNVTILYYGGFWS